MTDTTSPSAKKELEDFKVEHEALLKEHAVQESALLQLMSTVPIDNTKIAEAKSKLDAVSQKITDLTAQKSAFANSVDAEAISLSLQKQALIKSILAVVPKPEPGKLAIVHPSLNAAAILDYMTFTQHLNPYGRKRQCDKDLENLLAIIALDVSDAYIGYVQAVKAIEDVKP
jgi:hypothetical protein